MDREMLADRVEGMLLGALIGDAAGGPVEFARRDDRRAVLGGRWFAQRERIDGASVADLARSFALRGYSPLRASAEPYGAWSANAPAGTLTDDTRLKIILLRALQQTSLDGCQLTPEKLAKEMLRFADSETVRRRPHYAALCRSWLTELRLAARWLQGVRDTERALPPSRLWGGIATNCGQLMMLPLAALYPGQPQAAYRACYALDFVDNGQAKDLCAAAVAGLAFALTEPQQSLDAGWLAVEQAMRSTDPLRYGSVPWVPRAVDRWLDVAASVADGAAGQPALFFSLLEEAADSQTGWEAHLPLLVTAATLRLCSEPLAALQLVLQFGHDADSNAQLLGAFVGALAGASVFPDTIRSQVSTRLEQDYDERLEHWTALLVAGAGLSAG